MVYKKQLTGSLFFLGIFDNFGRWRRGLEALEQEGRVEHKSDRNRDQRVHEEIQFWLSKAVLPKPIENFFFGQNVT